MEVSAQLHVPAVLTPEREPPVFFGKETEWAANSGGLEVCKKDKALPRATI